MRLTCERERERKVIRNEQINENDGKRTEDGHERRVRLKKVSSGYVPLKRQAGHTIGTHMLVYVTSFLS